MIKGLIIAKTRTNRLCTGAGPGSARAVKGEVQVRVGGGSPRCNPSAPWLPGCRSTGLLRTCAPLPSRKTGGNTNVWIILNMLMLCSDAVFSTEGSDNAAAKVMYSAGRQYRRAMPGARVQGTRDDCDTGGMTNKDTRAAWCTLSREAADSTMHVHSESGVCLVGTRNLRIPRHRPNSAQRSPALVFLQFDYAKCGANARRCAWPRASNFSQPKAAGV